MLQWNDMHPYNAVHVVRIPKTLDWERLRHVLGGTLGIHGLSRLKLNRDKGTYHYLGGPAICEIKTVAGGEDVQVSLASEIEHQLNTRFSCDKEFNPFRFLVLPERDSFFLGLVYLHAVADAASVVLLLKGITNAYLGRSGKGLIHPIDRYPSRYDNLLRRHPEVLARKLAAMPSLVRDVRSSSRPPCHDARDLHNRFVLFSLQPAHLSALLQAGKKWKVTLNDLLLALLMLSLSPMTANRTQARRRRSISLGCIVNLRKDLGVDSQRTFGLFLGSFIVTHEVPPGISLIDLAQDVCRQTASIKRNRLYLGTPLDLAVARLMFSLFSTERRRKFYQKHYPLWGGITNMNLNSLWEQKDGERPVDYFRAVSTGPATPLVLSATTVGEVLNVGLTYRSAVYAVAEIEQWQRRFLNAVEDLPQGK